MLTYLRTTKLAFGLWACCMAIGAAAQSAPQTNAPSDDEIRRLLMQASIAAYNGQCPCPDSRNSDGERCGGNSAYSRGRGERPLCNPSDVTDAMIRRYRESLPKP